MWTLGQTVVAARVSVDNESFPLRDGPGTKAEGDDELKKFLSKYTLPQYREAHGTVDEQEVEGEDPELEVEAIVGKKFTGAKARYLVKWKGHVKRTWEPLSPRISRGARRWLLSLKRHESPRRRSR